MPAAKEAALKALAIDETVAYAHVALGFVLHYYEWDRPGAEREYRRALDLNPGDTDARCWYAQLLTQAGHTGAAIAEARHAIERDPLASNGRVQHSLALCMARRFEAAVAKAHTGIELDPTHIGLFWSLGWASVGLAKYNEAVESFRQATVVAPADPVSPGYLGWACGLSGRRQEALTILGDLERRRSQEYFSGWLMAHVSLGLGEHEQAIGWLQKAAEERDGLLMFLKVHPFFDSLRADPRFQTLLRRMNFPSASETGAIDASSTH